MVAQPAGWREQASPRPLSLLGDKMSKFGSLELDVDQVHKMTIIHPDNNQPLRDKDGKEAYIAHYSADSDVARKMNRESARRRLNSRRTKISPEELEAEGVELLAAMTSDWYLVAKDGTPLDVPFTQENARELYSSRKMQWLREQVDNSATDRANFSKGSPTS
jgi:hypothetical protein